MIIVIILIILEFILLWPSLHLLRKWLKRKNKSKFYLLASIVLLTLFTIIPIGYYQFSETVLNPAMRSTKFNSEMWKNQEYDRYKMINDILDNEIFNGKTREEIFKLLGNEYETGPCNNCIGYSINDPDIGFSIDHDVLVLYFDSLGKVIEANKAMW